MRSRMNFYLLGFLLFCVLPLGLGASLSPETGRMQGRLFDEAGLPMEGPVGLTLSVYESETGGSAVYQENHASVPLAEGSFSVTLGQGVPVTGTHDETLYTGGGERWIEIAVEGETLTPRQRVHAVPYALVAEVAESVPALESRVANIEAGSLTSGIDVTGSADVSGYIYWGDDNRNTLSNADGGSIELGNSSLSSSNRPKIDFHFGENVSSDDDYPNYNVRLQNDADHVLTLHGGDFEIANGDLEVDGELYVDHGITVGGLNPIDAWSPWATWLQGNLGSIGTQGGYGLTMVWNGYRQLANTFGVCVENGVDTGETCYQYNSPGVCSLGGQCVCENDWSTASSVSNCGFTLGDQGASWGDGTPSNVINWINLDDNGIDFRSTDYDSGSYPRKNLPIPGLRMRIAPTGDVTLNGNLHVSGDADKPGGGSWSVASDGRLKEQVRPLDGSLETLLALQGVTFRYKDPDAIGELQGERVGFVAQDVEEVFPDWISEGHDGYKRMTVRGFEALAVEALRELRTEQDAEIALLRKELALLHKRMSQFESETSSGVPR